MTSQTSREAVVAALSDCQRFYQARLPDSSWAGPYLSRRGMNDPSLGYAPAGWTTTSDHLRDRGYDVDTLLAAGISIRSRRGTVIDLLRDRVTVPIGDPRHPVAFIARAHPQCTDQPKWVNTPGTQVWDKHSTLYGVQHRDRLRRGVMPVVVEGTFDALAITAAAASRVHVQPVASCGTAVTIAHLDWLTDAVPATTPIAFAFDSDAAGEKALLAAWEATISHPGFRGRQLLHIDLGVHGDPAEAYAADPAGLRRALIQPRPLAEKVADLRITQAGSLDHVGKRVHLARHLVATDFPGVYRHSRARWIGHVAHRLDIPSAELTAMATSHLAGIATVASLAPARAMTARAPSSGTSPPVTDQMGPRHRR